MEKLENPDTDKSTWKDLSQEAWSCRINSRILGTTRVGAAAMSTKGKVFCGCNIEHRFRSHDVHAEVSAISSLVSAGETKLERILVVADRENFTPCGSCMDWIYELGGPECIVGFQNKEDGNIIQFSAKELMPHYPN